MARTIATIQAQIISQINTTIPSLTSPSQTALYNLMAYVVAVAINILEQLNDIFTGEIEADVAAAAPGTPAWLQQQVFNFQYSTSTPQVISMVNGAPVYATVNPSLRIVTQCSITTDINGTVTVKVASNLQPLTSLQMNALNAYLNQIGVAGVYTVVVSDYPDLIYIPGTVYYNGQYSSVIQNNVITAINNFFSTLDTINFNGAFELSQLESAILAVAGVEDWVPGQISGRSSGEPAPPMRIVPIVKQYSSTAGYMIPETAAGYTLQDSLTFVIQ